MQHSQFGNVFSRSYVFSSAIYVNIQMSVVFVCKCAFMCETSRRLCEYKIKFDTDQLIQNFSYFSAEAIYTIIILDVIITF